MATKDNRFSYEDKQNVFDDKAFHNQFKNLNLNQNYKCAFQAIPKSKGVTSDNKRGVQSYDFTVSQAKKDLNSWNKSNKQNPSSNFLNLYGNFGEKDECKKAKSSNNTNNSTLSLHIEAYENSVEVTTDGGEKEELKKGGEKATLVKKWATHGLKGSSSFIQNPFEFPRQQDDEKKEPEVMQFKASQQLLNPNEMQQDPSATIDEHQIPDSQVAKKDAKEIGLAFAKKYYEGAIHGSNGVMELFGDNSVYVDTDGKEARGLEDIRTAIDNLNLQEGKILVVSMNAGFTDKGGILVQCLVNYTTEKTKSGFSESFHLVPQSKGWYVRACLFKWHEESFENVKSKESTLSAIVEQPKLEFENRQTTEIKKSTSETGAKAAKEVKKPSNKVKAYQPKDRDLINGASNPPATPPKNIPAPQKNPKRPLVSAAPVPSPVVAPVTPSVAEPPSAPVTPSVAPSAPSSVAAHAPPSAPEPPSAPAPSSVAAPTAPVAPTSWAACVVGSIKSANTAPDITVTNNGSKNVESSATTVNSAASNVAIKSPPTDVTTAANGNTSVNLEGAQNKQHRYNKKPARPKSDFTVHVSKIVKGKMATERDVVVDITKAFQEFGPVTHVRVPGRLLADNNESTIYAFVDFKEKEDFEKIFVDRDNEGRVKHTIDLPVLAFNGEVVIAQNHGSARRNFYRNNRRPGNNGRPGNGRPPQRHSRNNGHSGNRPPHTDNRRNQSGNGPKENKTMKAKND